MFVVLEEMCFWIFLANSYLVRAAGRVTLWQNTTIFTLGPTPIQKQRYGAFTKRTKFIIVLIIILIIFTKRILGLQLSCLAFVLSGMTCNVVCVASCDS